MPGITVECDYVIDSNSHEQRTHRCASGGGEEESYAQGDISTDVKLGQT